MESDFDNLFDRWISGSEQSGSDNEARPEKTPNYSSDRILEVRVVNVFEAISDNPATGESTTDYFVLLQDNRNRKLRIFVSREMAHSIYVGLRGVLSDRPLTHDFIKTCLGKLNASVERVVIDDILNVTYYARIILNNGEELIEIDARPSDAIALAMRCKAPVYAAESVLESAGEID